MRKPRLNGAKVVLLREKNEPVTSNRPSDFDQEADLWVREKELNLKKKYAPGIIILRTF